MYRINTYNISYMSIFSEAQFKVLDISKSVSNLKILYRLHTPLKVTQKSVKTQAKQNRIQVSQIATIIQFDKLILAEMLML